MTRPRLILLRYRDANALLLAACLVGYLAAVLGFLWFAGCSSQGVRQVWDAVSTNALMIGLGALVGVLVALAAGWALVPAGGAGAAGATAAALTAPPQTVINTQGGPVTLASKGAYGMPIWIWIAIGFALAIAVRNRHWLPFFFSKQAKGYRLRLLKHFIAGGRPPVIPPQFIKDVSS